MKSFKKVLCLVLVVVMALGVSTVAFAGNLDKFDDADKAVAPYAEAVDVLIGLKVVNGVTTTELALDQSYTREQAAKVIAYLLLGQKSADALSADSAPFADVEASRWSAGYIAFCVKQGIIAGYDANTFGPADNLTGYQFAKMLLTAVGYGKNSEYVGEGWSINVAKDALGLGIFAGDLAAATNAAISRKQAMLMAFNTLIDVPTVNYNANFESYYTGASFVDGVKDVTAHEDDNDPDNGYKYTLGWKVFGVEMVDNSNNDHFGRESHTWNINTRTKISDAYSNVPDFSFTGKVSESALYNALGKTVSEYDNDVYIDGDLDATDAAIGKGVTTAFGATGGSSTLEVYVDDDAGYNLIVIINNYFAQVTDVDEDEEETTFDVYIDSDQPESITFATTAFEEDDYAYVNIYDDGADWAIDKAVAAEKLEAAEITAFASGYLRLDGTSYNKAAMLVGKDVPGTYTVGDMYDVYLDNFNNIIGLVTFSESASSLKYLYVNDSDADYYGAIAGNAYVKIAADLADGTSKVVNLAVKNPTKDTATYTAPDGTVTNIFDEVTANGNDIIDSGFYSYTVNSDGFYTIKDLASNVHFADAVSFADGKARISFTDIDDTTADVTLNATTTTSLILVDDQTTYTGYSKFPDFADLNLSAGYKVLYTMNTAGTRLVNIFIFGESSVKTSVIFGVFDSLVETDVDYNHYKVYVDGGYKTFLTEQTLTGVTKGETVVSIEEDSDGIATITPIVARVGSGTVADYELWGTVASPYTVNTVDSGYFTAQDGSTTNNYIFDLGDADRDYVIFDALKDTAVKRGSLKADQSVIFVVDGDYTPGTDTDFTVLAVVIVPTPTPAP